MDDPPLDDEVEELLYIRELVTFKFQETSRQPGRSEASGEEDPPRITSRRVDLSAPKFRTSQRRRVADRTSFERERNEQRSRGRATLTGTSKDTSPSQTLRSRRQASSAGIQVGRLVCPDDGGVCRIQVGPPVHINAELTRQDLDDVHISPGSSPACRPVNAATYVLRHESLAEGSSVSVDNNRANESMMTPRSRRRARIASRSSREKREKLSAVETAVETTSPRISGKLEEDIRVIVGNKSSDDENEQSEAIIPQLEGGGEEARDEEVGPRDVEGTKMLERPTMSAMNEEAIGTVGKSEFDHVSQAEMMVNNAETRHMGDGRIFQKKSGVGSPGRQNDVTNKVQVKNQGDQSQPSLASVSRRVSFPRSENIARPCRTSASLKQYRTIDGYLPDTLRGHDRSGELCDVITEEIRSSDLSWDDVKEVELYRPRLDELDSTLLSNDKKIERAIRAVQDFAGLLSKPEFAKYRSKEKQRGISSESLQIGDLSGERSNKNSIVSDESTTSLSVAITTPKNQVARVSDADSKETSVAPTETKSSAFTRRDLQSSMESTERRTSDGSRMSPDEDDAQQSKAKACLSVSSMDKSNISTFPNLPPALSSTRTDTQSCRSRQEQGRITQTRSEAFEDRYADSKSRVTNGLGDSANKTEGQMKEEYNIDDIFAQILRGLKDETKDRFVAYILKDERYNIEGKVAKVLKDSAIASTIMEKILARLQEADSVDEAARRTETLDVLKEILSSVKSRTDGVVNDEVTKEEKETEKVDFHSISPRAVDESTKARTRIASNENAQLIEEPHDLESRVERPETRGSITRTIPGSQGNSERDLHSEGESLKMISDILSDEAGGLRENSQSSPAKTMSVRSQKEHETEANSPDAATTAFQDEKRGLSVKEREYKSDEMKDGKESSLEDRYSSKNIPLITTDRMNDTFLGMPSGALVVTREHEEETEVTAVKMAIDSTAIKDRKVSYSVSDGSGKTDDKREQSDSNRSKVIDETLAKKDLARSLTKAEEDTNNPAEAGNGSPANSCSADSLRDCASLRTLSSTQSNESPLKKIQSHEKKISLDVANEGNSTKASNHDRGESMTNGALESRGNGKEEPLKSVKSGGDEQPRLGSSMLRKRLSSSSSSISSITLDHHSG